jgi:signal transduction histidine kinase
MQSGEADPRSLLGIGLLVVIGGFGAVANLAHALNEETVVVVLIGYGPAVVLSIALLASAVWLFRTEADPVEVHRVGTWTGLGFGAAVGIMSLNVGYQFTEGTPVSEPFFLLLEAGISGAFGGFLVGVYDHRSRRRERKLQAERDRIDAYNRRLAVLNRVLRHDLRSATTVIDGYASLVRGAPADADGIDDHLRAIQQEANRMNELGEKARELGRLLDVGRERTVSVDLAELVDAAAASFRDEYPAANLAVRVPSGFEVRATPQLDVAVEELLTNAVEHHDGSSPSVTVSARSGPSEDTAVLRIEDDGPGIPAEERTVLEREDETQLEHLSGIGLWLVKWIVRESGGSMRFRHREPRGTIVELSLPLALESEETPDRRGTATPVPTSGD